MPHCCRCNGSGRCVSCACARNGKACTNCTPGRNGRCENFSVSTLSPDNATVVQPSPFETLQDLQSLVETRDTTYNNLNDIGDGRQTGSEPESPRHHALLPPDFLWGEKTGEVFSQLVSSAYEEMVHWRHNIFLIPSVRAGKAFVRELARLYQAYADASTLECIALKAGTVLQCLLLQKLHAKSKSKDHSTHLERRLKLWLDGDISTLLHEGRCIQRHLPSPTNQEDNLEKNARVFSRLMLQGKVNAALHFVSKDTNRGILSLDSLIPTGKYLNGEITWQTTINTLERNIPKGRWHQQRHSSQNQNRMLPNFTMTQLFFSR